MHSWTLLDISVYSFACFFLTPLLLTNILNSSYSFNVLHQVSVNVTGKKIQSSLLSLPQIILHYHLTLTISNIYIYIADECLSQGLISGKVLWNNILGTGSVLLYKCAKENFKKSEESHLAWKIDLQTIIISEGIRWLSG